MEKTDNKILLKAGLYVAKYFMLLLTLICIIFLCAPVHVVIKVLAGLALFPLGILTFVLADLLANLKKLSKLGGKMVSSRALPSTAATPKPPRKAPDVCIKLLRDGKSLTDHPVGSGAGIVDYKGAEPSLSDNNYGEVAVGGCGCYVIKNKDSSLPSPNELMKADEAVFMNCWDSVLDNFFTSYGRVQVLRETPEVPSRLAEAIGIILSYEDTESAVSSFSKSRVHLKKLIKELLRKHDMEEESLT